MGIAARFILIVASASLLVSAVYVWIIPLFFNGHKTSVILVFGVIFSALAAALDFYFNGNVESMILRCSLSVVAAVTSGALVLFFSLLIILNIRGT
jgi:hypothetical protein